MSGIMDALTTILQTLLACVAIVAGLWWLWQGIAGTFELVKYLTKTHFWRNTCWVVVLGLLFGWNVLLIGLVVLVCLGPATRALARRVWKRWLSQHPGR
jgi:hypothetical protein